MSRKQSIEARWNRIQLRAELKRIAQHPSAAAPVMDVYLKYIDRLTSQMPTDTDTVALAREFFIQARSFTWGWDENTRSRMRSRAR